MVPALEHKPVHVRAGRVAAREGSFLQVRATWHRDVERGIRSWMIAFLLLESWRLSTSSSVMAGTGDVP